MRILVCAAAVILLAGCVSTAPGQSAAVSSEQEGSGPALVTIDRYPDSAYFMAHFGCAGDGAFRVELREDARVFMGGTCSESQPLNPGKTGYQMPLPAGATLTFDISVDSGAEWEFGGDFMPAQGSFESE